MVDWNKPKRLRNGGRVNIFTTRALSNPKYPVRGEYEVQPGVWVSASWTLSGKQFHFAVHNSEFDIVNVPGEHTVDVYFYKHVLTGKVLTDVVGPNPHDIACGLHCIGKLRHTFTEGDGLQEQPE